MRVIFHAVPCKVNKLHSLEAVWFTYSWTIYT